MGGEIDERAIFDKGPVVVFKWRNAEGWPVEYASRNAREVFGYSADELVRGDVTYGSLVHAEDAPRVAREVATATEGDTTSFVHEPYRVTRRDGRTIWLYDFTKLQRDASGAVTHYLGYVIDITAQVEATDHSRELERQLLHAQRLESLGLLAGGVAHDFNNLLTAMLGQAHAARAGLPAGATRSEEALSQIERLARRAADLTRQLLAYSGRGRFVVEPVDLGEVLREIASMMSVALPRNARLTLDLAADLPTIQADRAQTLQIAMNLLTNAGEALDGAPGTVTLRTYSEECSDDRLRDVYGRPDRERGRFVVLEVTDTGRGMEPETIGRLFEPFFSTKAAGRGLGLSAVQGIVRAHGGIVHVTSAPARGTTFKILFPASASPVPAKAVEVSTTTSDGRSVLVVDDDEGIRATLAMLLRDLGYRVTVAAGGAEALEAIESHAEPFGVMLLDVTMPSMSGRDVLAALDARGITLPVVLMSGYTDAEGVAHERAAAFLVKPYGLDELTAALAKALDGPRSGAG